MNSFESNAYEQIEQKAPEDKRDEGSLEALDKKSARVVAITVVEEGCSREHKENGDGPIKSDLDS